MSKRYWGIFAAIGLALACANHAYAEGGDQKANAEQSIASSLQDIATTNRQEAERAERADEDESPCGEGQYGSNSDLCAQWKAADSAANSAWWAWVAGISTIISTAAVLVAIALTYQANAIARSTAKNQLRAYVVMNAIKFTDIIIDDIVTGWDLELRWKNTGQTPALFTACQMIMHFRTDGTPLPEDFDFSDDSPKGDTRGTLGPGEHTNTQRIHISQIDMGRIHTGRIRVFVWSWFEYDDVFTNKRRRSETCFELTADSASLNGGFNVGHKHVGRHNGMDDSCFHRPMTATQKEAANPRHQGG